MPQPDLSQIPVQLRELELARGSRAIVLAASHLDMELLPALYELCLLYTSPSPRDRQKSRMPSSA